MFALDPRSQSMFQEEINELSESEREAETRAFDRILRAFGEYRIWTQNYLDHKRSNLRSLPDHYQSHLKQHHQTLDIVQDRLVRNHVFIQQMLQSHNPPAQSDSVSEGDMDKVRSTLRQFVRDWSLEGDQERSCSYGPILKELDTRFAKLSNQDRAAIKVLVPGAGLGRLAYEIASRGNKIYRRIIILKRILLPRK